MLCSIHCKGIFSGCTVGVSRWSLQLSHFHFHFQFHNPTMAASLWKRVFPLNDKMVPISKNGKMRSLRHVRKGHNWLIILIGFAIAYQILNIVSWHRSASSFIRYSHFSQEDSLILPQSINLQKDISSSPPRSFLTHPITNDEHRWISRKDQYPNITMVSSVFTSVVYTTFRHFFRQHFLPTPLLYLTYFTFRLFVTQPYSVMPN